MKLKIPSKNDGFQPMFLESGGPNTEKSNGTSDLQEKINKVCSSKWFLGFCFVCGAIGFGLAIPAFIKANNNKDDLNDLEAKLKPTTAPGTDSLVDTTLLDSGDSSSDLTCDSCNGGCLYQFDGQSKQCCMSEIQF